ncbi:DNRLRE domain-containing protein [Micromonospora sp. HK10]|uniref:CBM96 family carbohydrate-binding protein n=1 Tax=Micromonospora sp. HK10 TaxID=1538294 RepID=UPI0006977BAC|nr:DNRLRE domain-containing protein [Micromonospora sp. HK10]
MLRSSRRRTAAAGLAAIAAVSVLGPAGTPARATPAGTGAAAVASTRVTVPASLDTYVVAEAPTNSYGTATKLTSANWTTWHSESYVRFQVPTDSRPIVGAWVEFTSNKSDQQPTRLELRALTGTWSETTTYATRPTVGATVASATLPGSGVGTYSFSVGTTVRAPGTVNFALVNPTAESVASVQSREQGTGPRLVIDYSWSTSTLCGASFNSETAGETYQQALARIDGYYNGLESVRVFYRDLPQAWPGKLNVGGRPMIVSFKAAPAEVNSGKHDAYLREWFRTAPTNQDIYWTYYHEPENDNFAPDAFVAAFRRVSGLAAAAGNPRLRATLILMGWTLESGSHRDWTDWYPGRQYVDVLGWDVYNEGWKNGTYNAPANMFAKVIAVSRQEGLPFGIAETGSPLVAGDPGSARAAWLRALSSHLTAEGALFVDYFDLDWREEAGIDYRLRDSASMTAWREFCG